MRRISWIINYIKGVIIIFKHAETPVATLINIWSKRKAYPLLRRYSVEALGRSCIVRSEVILTPYSEFEMIGYLRDEIKEPGVCILYRANGFIATKISEDTVYGIVMPNDVPIPCNSRNNKRRCGQ